MERFAAIDFEIANGKRSSICSIGVAIIEDNKVIDSVYMLVRPYPNEAYDLAYPKYQFYCTCRLSRRMYPFLANHQLQTVAAHCGYDLIYHHHAMADAYACAHIAATMMREKGVERLCDL